MAPTQHLLIDPTNVKPPTRDDHHPIPQALPVAKKTNLHPIRSGGENASIYFVGTATTILEWAGIRLMTDPNFLHAGDHVHLGPGVTAVRETNPAIDLHELPRIDLVCLSHYHEDHFDKKVEASLRRDLPIITTPHAKHHLDDAKPADEKFTAVTALDTYDSAMVEIKSGGAADDSIRRGMRVTAMPGKHVPPGPLATINEYLGVVPPTNGWILELGYLTRRTATAAAADDDDGFETGYRIYISGDTLLVDELKEIPKRYPRVDLMLVHLGGTTIPSKKLPLIMVTMDAEQGLGLVRLVKPDITIPIHFDDYDMFLTPLSEFRKVVDDAGLSEKVVYLDRGDGYSFRVRAPT